MRGVAARHDVSLIVHGDRGFEPSAISTIVSPVHVVPQSGAASSARLLIGLLRGRSRPRQQQATNDLARTVERLVRTLRPDIVQWETPFLACGGVNGALQVLDEHNLWAELIARRRRLRRSPLKRALLALEGRAVAAEERRLWAHADATLFTSGREAAIASVLGARNPVVVPNGVDLDRFAPPVEAGESSGLLFIGLLSYDPNRDAIEYFADQVLPRLDRRRPGITVTLIGRDPPAGLLRRLGPRVRYLGAVPDVRPHLARAAVVLAPLRYGSGTRLKVLESLAAARPVVATSCAVEGLDVAHLEHLLIADTPDAFAEAILRVLDDKALAQRLGGAGRTLVEQRYSWRRITDDLAVMYERLVMTRTGRSAHAGIW